MAELTFKSPGVSTREIDLSGPTAIQPQGTPAGIIGTANQGPAFVPITIATYQDFVAKFGATDGEKFGPLAMYEWMLNAKAGTYLRVLGVGDGKQNLASAGSDSNSNSIPAGGVKNAGFIVGSQQVKGNGYLGHNAYANYGSNGGSGATAVGGAGRTYFLGAFMSESNGSDFLSSAGIQLSPRAEPIVRGVLMAASGVLPALSGNYALANSASTISQASFASGYNGGAPIGAINIETTNDYSFVVILNGHKHTSEYPNVITCSMSPNNSNFYPTVLNTDPTKIQNAGHYLYARYDIDTALAVVTGSGILANHQSSSLANRESSVFMVTSSYTAWNNGSAGTATYVGVPNYENFSTRFRTAFSPWVISQKFGGKFKNLFQIHALDDGDYANSLWKVSIENLANSNIDNDYGKFDLVVRGFGDTDTEPQVLESFRGLTIDPNDENYIGRRVGDMNAYFDFDKSVASQKLVIEGAHSNKSVYIRVKMDSEVDNATMDKTALPTGYRGPHHLVTSGSSTRGNGGTVLSSPSYPVAYDGKAAAGGILAGGVWGGNITTPPIPTRTTVARGTGTTKRSDPDLYWGSMFQKVDSLTEPNKNTVLNASFAGAFTKYFPNYGTGIEKAWQGGNTGTATKSGCVLDSDLFNNNLFSLERVQVLTKSASDVVDSNEWQAAAYKRNAELSSSLEKSDATFHQGRFLNVSKDFGEQASKKYYKFSFFVQGGFNGVNLFDDDKSKMLSVACNREIDDTNQGATAAPTVGTYRKALDVMAEKSDVDIQILAVPGIRESNVTDHALDKTEERFDAIYIMDIEERDTLNTVITSSISEIGVNNTVADFKNRTMNSSFGAAYFPDVIIKDPATLTNLRCPPSVAVLGAFGLNDKVAYPWFAPAGFTRGALKNVLESQVKLSRNNLDALYDADINPITSFPDTDGTVIFGQKTLLAAASSLDRVNVRRLLIDIRRKVRRIADTFLFEPNRESTLARFSASVNPVLQRIQQQQGLDRFKVVIDTTTTTQADIENNTVRGKIFLQPTRSVEFISLDFVVTNNGTEI
jgi:hypothetical protein